METQVTSLKETLVKRVHLLGHATVPLKTLADVWPAQDPETGRRVPGGWDRHALRTFCDAHGMQFHVHLPSAAGKFVHEFF